MVQDTSGISHTAGRNDNFGTGHLIDHPGFLRRRRKTQLRYSKQPFTVHFVQSPRFLIIFLRVGQRNGSSLTGHGAVDNDRHFGYTPLGQ